MKRALVLACFSGGATFAAHACEPGLRGDGVQRVESARYVLAFRTTPATLEVGRHFALDLAACAKNGAPPQSVNVDAHMPAHRHGMNYAPTVRQIGTNRWRAEGLLFHMPGDWEFRFDLRADGSTDRLAYTHRLD